MTIICDHTPPSATATPAIPPAATATASAVAAAAAGATGRARDAGMFNIFYFLFFLSH